jgi:hypothetical protein
MDLSFIKEKAFTNIRFDKIQEAFTKSVEKHGDYRLAPVKQVLGSKFSYDEIRLARIFIQGEAQEIF